MPVTSETRVIQCAGIFRHWQTAERVMPSASASFAADPAASTALVTVGSIMLVILAETNAKSSHSVIGLRRELGHPPAHE